MQNWLQKSFSKAPQDDDKTILTGIIQQIEEIEKKFKNLSLKDINDEQNQSAHDVANTLRHLKIFFNILNKN